MDSTVKNKNQINMEKCPRYQNCSIPICPLDCNAAKRTCLPGENICSFTIKKKTKSQKGIRTQMSAHLTKFVPESNLKMLNRGNQKRWNTLHKKVELKINKNQII